jgi:antitoxin (DNA-binding transcriptional repressor) of toxin-antitoxin stability system
MQAARSSDQQPTRTVGIGELKSRADEIVREVSETGRPIDIALGGKIVARLSPTQSDETRGAEDRRQAMLDWLRETEAFAQDVARRWPSAVSAVELVHEQRRDL